MPTNIEWVRGDDGMRGETWNPLRGCRRKSPGCQACYAEVTAHRFSGPGQPYEGLTQITNGRPQWTGVVRLVPEKLEDPLHWRKPRRIFVNSMSDLFHEDVPDEFIDRVFGVMALCPQHTFQVLTKRAERLPVYFGASDIRARVWRAARPFAERVLHKDGYDALPVGAPGTGPSGVWVRDWPLPQVHLGVSVEDQQRADERIPHLLKTPAAVRWISAEPLLGPLDLRGYLVGGSGPWLDWVVAGGES